MTGLSEWAIRRWVEGKKNNYTSRERRGWKKREKREARMRFWRQVRARRHSLCTMEAVSQSVAPRSLGYKARKPRLFVCRELPAPVRTNKWKQIISCITNRRRTEVVEAWRPRATVTRPTTAVASLMPAGGPRQPPHRAARMKQRDREGRGATV